MQARRLIDVARHVDVEQHQVGIDRELGAGAPDLVDDAEPALEQRHRADRRAADPVGEEHAVALDLAAVERTVAQRLQERRTAGDGIGRARRDRDLLLVDFEPDRGLVFEAVDQDGIAQIGVAVVA